ncbi:MAG: copper resistance D family protein [Vitreoscilla sp.]
MSAASLLQLVSVVALDACFAMIVGTLSARIWLRGSSSSPHHGDVVRSLRRTETMAIWLALLAAFLSMWAAAAVMMGSGLGPAAAMLWTMALQTAYGQAGLAGIAILAAVAASRTWAPRSMGTDVVVALLLLGFAAARASVSHAGENGLASLAFGVEWLHLVLIALWFGGVATGGWIVLPQAHPQGWERLPVNRYLALLSHAATVALFGIVATGLYNAWQRVGSVQNLSGNLYGDALVVKLAFVGSAMALGGYNKLIGFPAATKSASSSPKVIAILRVESLLLLGALVAAAVLTTNQPPMAI